MAASTSMDKIAWVDKLLKAEKTSFLHNGKRKIHYKFMDGQEMAEEYDVKTDELTESQEKALYSEHNVIGRKCRTKTTLSGVGRWQIEVGEPVYSEEQLETDGLRENIQNPAFYRLDTKTSFQWKVRNASHPLDNYQVSVETKSREIVIRTLNKTYYKRFSIPDLDRFDLPYDKEKLSVAHQLNTLIVKYEKPAEILRMETMLREQLKKLIPHEEGRPDDCQPS